MKGKKVWFKSDNGISLYGLLASPNKESKGAVILAHGITVEKNEGGFYRRLANLLAKNQLTSLRFDFRGHGDSSGEFSKITIKGEINDLSAAVNLLKAIGYKKIAIVGTSFGASVAVLYAKRKPATISSLTLLCPVLDYKRTFLEPETEWAQQWFTQKAISKAKQTGKLNLDGFHLGYNLLQEFRRFKPGETLLTLNIPTLIVHGKEDSMVPYEVAQYYGKKYQKGNFLSIQNADHGFEGYENKVFPEVVKWILRNIEK